MKDVCYEFVELESDASIQLLGQTFGGVLHNNTFQFDNTIVKGDLVKINLEPGLWLRKWILTSFEAITLLQQPATAADENKFSLIYFLNPSLFSLRHNKKKFKINNQHNILFSPNKVQMAFQVLPKQPFYVLDITFTEAWLLQQFTEADSCFQHIQNLYLSKETKELLTQPCTAEEYRTLHELEIIHHHHNEDVLYNRSRIYSLICSFFSKVFHEQPMQKTPISLRYDQVIKAKSIVMENISAIPKIEVVAKAVNMSVSSLLRQFKQMFGKSIYDYVLEKKMELAKKMMVDERMDVKTIASRLGYQHASPFIEAFTKWHGCSPGKLKNV